MYAQADPPSSALSEKVASIAKVIVQGKEQALIGYDEEMPVCMVRYQVMAGELCFFRLSVIPEKQGKGLAKKMLHALERLAMEQEIVAITCKVRAELARNIALYETVGYTIVHEETVNNSNGSAVPIVHMAKRLV